MHLHYIEDDLSDAVLIQRLLEARGNVQVSISQSLADFIPATERARDTGVLVDIRRPDALSIEDDMAKLRARTPAPIVFITGGETEAVRERAITAGARDVIAKDSLRADDLHRLFRLPTDTADVELEDEEIAPPHIMPNFGLQQLHVPLIYLERELCGLSDAMCGTSQQAAIAEVHGMIKAVQAMRAFADADLKRTAPIPLHDVVATVLHSCEVYAAQKQIDLLQQGEWSWFSQAGNARLAHLGLHHLIHGVISEAPCSSRIRLNMEKSNGGAKLTILTDMSILDSTRIFFEDNVDGHTRGIAAASAFRLSATLLGLRPEQVRLSNEGPVHILSISL